MTTRRRRILLSRNAWKAKATIRGKQNRELRRQIHVERERRRFAERRLEEAPTKPYSDSNVVEINHAEKVRVQCVLLVVVAVMPFRSVPRALRILQPTAWIPHFTSIINWSLRVGLGLLNAVNSCAAPWIAIVDMSIDVATKKVLVVLRVPLETLRKKGSALSLQDVECIGVRVSEAWKSENISQALSEIFSIAGTPTAILKDRGTDISKGVVLWQDAQGTHAVEVIDDVGHVAANALEAAYSKLKTFIGFLKTLRRAAHRLRQSQFAFLAPPKIRRKGRFQSVAKLARWAMHLLPLLGGKGKARADSLASELQKKVPGLGKYRALLKRFSATCIAVNQLLELLKNKWLNAATFLQAESIVETLPPRSLVKKRLLEWLHKHLMIWHRLGLGETTLPVSSDVIETLFGKFKLMVMRNPKAEFNRIVLCIPALCGHLQEQTINQQLKSVNHRALEKWENENVQKSQWRLRRSFRTGKLKLNWVPKSVGKKRAI